MDLMVSDRLLILGFLQDIVWVKEFQSEDQTPSGSDMKQEEAMERSSQSSNSTSSPDEHNTAIYPQVRGVHTKGNFYSCHHCLRAFDSEHNLIGHLRAHIRPPAAEGSFFCIKCEMSFPEKSDYQEHSRTHIGERPFSCTKCGKSFTLKCNLKRHLKTHNRKKPFLCRECDESFTHKRYLNQHAKTHEFLTLSRVMSAGGSTPRTYSRSRIKKRAVV